MHNHELDNKCWYCERVWDFYTRKTKDHLIPKSRGGNNENINLRACCTECNTFKGRSTPEGFVELIEEKIRTFNLWGYHRCPFDVYRLNTMLTKAKMIVAFVNENREKMMVEKITWQTP